LFVTKLSALVHLLYVYVYYNIMINFYKHLQISSLPVCHCLHREANLLQVGNSKNAFKAHKFAREALLTKTKL